MFTGLVRTIGRVAAVHSRPEARRIAITSDLAASDLVLGASVCCSGACLTVVGSQAGTFEVDVAFESLRRTTIGTWTVGTAINLEPSLRVGDALGGHFVSGHVDGIGRVRSVAERGAAWELWIDLPDELMGFVAPKGSIAFDGTSLTINDVDARGLMVGIVPHTLGVTTIGRLAVGDAVNVEIDLLARYVARQLAGLAGRGAPAGITWAALRDAGFVDGETGAAR
jgi:riboflavin synthase